MSNFLQSVKRLLIGVGAVIVAGFCFFVCQGVFSGYPQYGTNILGPIGMFLIAITGGVAWIVDQRRIDADP